MLTDDQINVIANDVRTKPLAEVGRHVMPLIHHIAETQDRVCQSCRHWVPYNHAEAHEGECVRPRSRGMVFRVLSDGGDDVTHEVYLAPITPFDWSCAGWEQKPTATDDAQSCQTS